MRPDERGAVDRSERGKLALTGAQAKTFLHGQVRTTSRPSSPGTGCYAALLTQKGKMLGDLRVLDRGDELLRSTPSARAAGALRRAPPRVRSASTPSCTSARSQRGLLSLIGPRRRASPAPRTLPAAEEHANVAASSAGSPCVLVATDVGVDLSAPRGRRGAARRAARARRGRDLRGGRRASCASSAAARATASTSTTRSIPQEAGLNERAVSFTKGCYVGQETVARLHWQGQAEPPPARAAAAARRSRRRRAAAGEREVGRVGSVVVPALGPIALAIVRREAEPGRPGRRSATARRRGRRAAVPR